jgi:hypothetical protein
MTPYSQDLRKPILDTVQRGDGSLRQIARRFLVSVLESSDSIEQITNDESPKTFRQRPCARVPAGRHGHHHHLGRAWEYFHQRRRLKYQGEAPPAKRLSSTGLYPKGRQAQRPQPRRFRPSGYNSLHSVTLKPHAMPVPLFSPPSLRR